MKSTTKNPVPTIALSNGIKMPLLGYGVFQVEPEVCERCVRDALEVGYRLIDTAQAYVNELQVGTAIKASGIPREDIFLCTKVWIGNAGFEAALRSVRESLQRLQTDYLDLVLIHQPYSDYYGSWKALQELCQKGVIRAIGVSNFYPDRLVDLGLFSDCMPMVNQIECHPLFQRDADLLWAHKYGVVLEAWAPFGEGKEGLFAHPVLSEIAAKHGKSTAQVMLRWNIQRGVVVIPKSVHRERMEENFCVFDFELDSDDISRIAAMDGGVSLFSDHRTPESVEKFKALTDRRKKQGW